MQILIFRIKCKGKGNKKKLLIEKFELCLRESELKLH